jgi:hypothetical protein
MKRAAVQWGIGRYLYQTETGTAPENGKTSGGNAGQAPTQHSPVAKPGPYAPTVKQIAFYERLVSSPVFTEDERKRALTWLADKATRQTIKDQIDWLKRQVETRTPHARQRRSEPQGSSEGLGGIRPSHDKRTEFLIPVGGVLLRAKMPAPTRKGEASRLSER